MLVDNIATLGFNKCPQENESGAHDHNLFVTRNTTMPSVLIEAGFMSNDAEVRRIAKKETQEAIAQKIVETLVAFYSK
jgi:N-acetylmuramoyl-L-alanine amidase